LEERFSEADGLLRKTLKELEEHGVVPIDPEGVDIFAPLPDSVSST
jgi:hypothetical protein